MKICEDCPASIISKRTLCEDCAKERQRARVRAQKKTQRFCKAPCCRRVLQNPKKATKFCKYCSDIRNNMTTKERRDATKEAAPRRLIGGERVSALIAAKVRADPSYAQEDSSGYC